jgi:hypothetical protein
VDAANRAGEFVMLAKCLSVGRGNFADATDVAKAAHATPRVLGILEKAAVPQSAQPRQRQQVLARWRQRRSEA